MTAGEQQRANGHVEPRPRLLKLQDDVGFRTLPDQSVRRHFQHGFAFNILCIGETGIGKSTLMDSLFNYSFDLPASSHDHPEVKIMSKSFELIENNVKLNVGIVETMGYGDQINKQKSCQAIIDYIDSKFEGYLQEELQISRKLSTFRDGRIHVCLYFITPTGHGLKALDLVCMKQLDSKVNLIPVIAKSDIISKQDLAAFKRRVQSELTNSGVQIYQFPVDDPMSPQDANRQYNSLMPFAVIGSRDLIRVGSKTVRARQYPWGVVQIENDTHCDFTKLRDAVLRYNLADLVESTHVKHYELYRRMRLVAMGFNDEGISDSSTFERKRAEHRVALQKNEEDMRQAFIEKVNLKESELKAKDTEMNMRFDAMHKELFMQQKKLDEDKHILDEKIKDLQRKRQLVQQHNTMTLGKSKKR